MGFSHPDGSSGHSPGRDPVYVPTQRSWTDEAAGASFPSQAHVATEFEKSHHGECYHGPVGLHQSPVGWSPAPDPWNQWPPVQPQYPIYNGPPVQPQYPIYNGPPVQPQYPIYNGPPQGLTYGETQGYAQYHIDGGLPSQPQFHTIHRQQSQPQGCNCAMLSAVEQNSEIRNTPSQVGVSRHGGPSVGPQYPINVELPYQAHSIMNGGVPSQAPIYVYNGPPSQPQHPMNLWPPSQPQYPMNLWPPNMQHQPSCVSMMAGGHQCIPYLSSCLPYPAPTWSSLPVQYQLPPTDFNQQHSYNQPICQPSTSTIPDMKYGAGYNNGDERGPSNEIFMSKLPKTSQAPHTCRVNRPEGFITVVPGKLHIARPLKWGWTFTRHFLDKTVRSSLERKHQHDGKRALPYKLNPFITNINVPGESTGQFEGYAIITFKSWEAAYRAFEALTFDGFFNVRLDIFQLDIPHQLVDTNLYVAGLPPNTSEDFTHALVESCIPSTLGEVHPKGALRQNGLLIYDCIRGIDFARNPDGTSAGRACITFTFPEVAHTVRLDLWHRGFTVSFSPIHDVSHDSTKAQVTAKPPPPPPPDPRARIPMPRPPHPQMGIFPPTPDEIAHPPPPAPRPGWMRRAQKNASKMKGKAIISAPESKPVATHTTASPPELSSPTTSDTDSISDASVYEPPSSVNPLFMTLEKSLVYQDRRMTASEPDLLSDVFDCDLSINELTNHRRKMSI